MFHSLEIFKNGWERESQGTMSLLNNLTDESLNQKVYDGGRSLKDIAWHIVTTMNEMLGHTGLTIKGPAHDSEAPATAKEIADAYNATSKYVQEEVMSKWNDKMLFDEVEMYGEKWTYGVVLHALIGHQTHHRGQMTVLMRQAGLKVPGVYGPSKEEWEKYGMPPQK